MDHVHLRVQSRQDPRHPHGEIIGQAQYAASAILDEVTPMQRKQASKPVSSISMTLQSNRSEWSEFAQAGMLLAGGRAGDGPHQCDFVGQLSHRALATMPVTPSNRTLTT